MNILLLAAEAAPLAVASSLGEAAGSLARALAGLGHDVRVALPFSGVIDRQRFAPKAVTRFAVPHTGGDQTARAAEVRHAGVTYYLIAGPPVPRAKRVYGADIHEAGPKFIFTALAALGLCRALAWAPDVVHGFDSPSGPALYWLDTDGLHDPLFQQTASVFTLHDPAHTNAGAGRYLREYGLTPSDSPLLPDSARDSLLGLGLAHAGLLAVAGLTCTGGGLGDMLQARRERLAEIPGGLDLETWNPRTDRRLAARYDAGRLDRRAANKRALQKALGLPVAPHMSLIGVLAEGDGHGDPDAPGTTMTVAALRRLLAGAGAAQVVVLGSDLPAGEGSWPALAAEHPAHVRLESRADEALRRLFFAGSDVVFTPWRCPPGDPAALVALRYGAVPLVHAADGQSGTVIDYSVARRGTGFVFTDYNEESLLNALRRALGVYARPPRWQALQRRGLRQALRFSWPRAAETYLVLYQQATNYRKEAVTTLTHRLADDPAAEFSDGAGSRVAGAGQVTQP